MSSVYLILNETAFSGDDRVVTEVVEATLDFQWALDWIAELAAEHNVFVEDDANSVVIYGDYVTGVDTDEYYIAEMELKN